MNELQIKPNVKYDVYLNELGFNEFESFEADTREYNQAENSLQFFRTGNLIREYFNPYHTIRKVIATPIA